MAVRKLYLSRPKLWEELCDTWQCFGCILLHDASKREAEPVWGPSIPRALAGTIGFGLRVWGAAEVDLISRGRWRNNGGQYDAITLFPDYKESKWLRESNLIMSICDLKIHKPSLNSFWIYFKCQILFRGKLSLITREYIDFHSVPITLKFTTFFFSDSTVTALLEQTSEGKPSIISPQWLIMSQPLPFAVWEDGSSFLAAVARLGGGGGGMSLESISSQSAS